MSTRRAVPAVKSSRSSRSSRTSGKRRSRARATAGSQAAPTDGKYAIDSEPVRPSRTSATKASTSPRRLSAPSICSASASPTEVGSIPRPLRASRTRPVSRCSAVTCWLTAEEV